MTVDLAAGVAGATKSHFGGRPWAPQPDPRVRTGRKTVCNDACPRARRDPVTYSDPFGLCPDPNDVLCQLFEGAFTLAGATAGFIIGGGAGLLEIAATGGLATPAAVATAGSGMALGAAGGKALGQLLSNIVFSKGSGSSGGDSGDTSGLRKQLEEHRNKLEQYRNNPDAFDNRGFLKNAPNEEVRRRIIEGRIRNLERQIRNFEEQIRRIEQGGQ